MKEMQYISDCETTGQILSLLNIPVQGLSVTWNSSQFAPRSRTNIGFIRDILVLEALDMSPQIPILQLRRHGSGRHRGVQDLEIQALGSPLLKHSPKGI